MKFYFPHQGLFVTEIVCGGSTWWCCSKRNFVATEPFAWKFKMAQRSSPMGGHLERFWCACGLRGAFRPKPADTPKQYPLHHLTTSHCFGFVLSSVLFPHLPLPFWGRYVLFVSPKLYLGPTQWESIQKWNQGEFLQIFLFSPWSRCFPVGLWLPKTCTFFHLNELLSPKVLDLDGCFGSENPTMIRVILLCGRVGCCFAPPSCR